MKQRLLFARSILNEPDILFLDEPMSGLDPTTSARIKGLIREEVTRGATVFMTTHNMHTAEELCDEVAFLHQGEVIAMDTPRNLKLQYGERAIRVERALNGSVTSEQLFPDKPEDARRLAELVGRPELQTIHSQVATLEQIFIRLTGRGLE
jgi:fluoroquinolone transport system ATP-binding protein